MRRIHLFVWVVGLALAVSGCPKKKKAGPGTGVTPKAGTSAGTGAPKTDIKKPKTGPGALPADKAWASGNIKGASLELDTVLDVPGLKPKKGAPGKGSKMTQTIWVTDGRGKIVFTTPDSYIPQGTELRYNGATNKYVLADGTKKQYWVMSGSQLGNLLEGGPELKRTGYTVKVTDTKEKAKVAGFDTLRSNAEIGFNWSVKAKGGDKSGKITVKLALWHTADKKLKGEWGSQLVSLLCMPFQDAEGQKVVDELKKKIKFPVKWSMEIIQEGGKQQKGEAYPKLVTTATAVEVKDLDKAGLAWPPAGFGPASGPYQMGAGGQTASEADLGKLPAGKGKKPKGVEPAGDEKGAKKKS